MPRAISREDSSLSLFTRQLSTYGQATPNSIPSARLRQSARRQQEAPGVPKLRSPVINQGSDFHNVQSPHASSEEAERLNTVELGKE